MIALVESGLLRCFENVYAHFKECVSASKKNCGTFFFCWPSHFHGNERLPI